MLSTGTRIGIYEVVAQIGAGGMGEVYRARDTRLNRDVALKVLPEAFSRDMERMARFEREAKVLASLNHPNIAAIYGLEESGPIRALVMELVEGPTLAERIRGGAIPVDEALPIARQVAEAVEYAHDKNVIHRDLKPANIKVTAEGTVKVLDFGLAKALSDEIAGEDMSNSPTLSMAATRQGVILGTAGYMAPEQARGRIVDRRADIWAFGAILFEMLTGRQAFADEDISMTLSKVLQRDPDFDALPADLPARVRQAVKLCLRKDAKQRIGDFRDVRLAMEGAFETAAPSVDAAPLRAHGSNHTWIAAFVLGLILASGASWSWRSRTTGQASGPVRHSALAFTSDGATRLNGTSAPSMDAAGRLIVVKGAAPNGVGQLFLHRFDKTDSVPISGTEGVVDSPAVSPDGKWVAYWANDRLNRVALTGGAPQKVSSLPERPNGIAWIGSESLIVGGSKGLLRIPAEGGEPKLITTVNAQAGEVDHRWPSVTPDGRILAYMTWSGSTDTARIRLRSLPDGREQTLMQGSSPKVTPTWFLVFSRGNDLWGAPIDPATLKAQGEAQVVLEGIQSQTSGEGYFGFSSDGLLAYGRRQDRALPLKLVDRNGRQTGMVGEEFRGVHHGPPQFSPDGRLLAITNHRTGGDDQVVVYDLLRGTSASLGAQFDSRFPVWAPKGTLLTFASRRLGSYDIFEKDINGSGDSQQLLVADGEQVPLAWTPDGEALAYRDREDIWLLHADKKKTLLVKNVGFNGAAAFSPDGRFFAYETNETGRLEVWVQEYPTAVRRLRVSTAGGMTPFWTADSRGVYFLDNDKTAVLYATVADGSGLRSDAVPNRLFNLEIGAGSGASDPVYGVSADGRTFAIIRDPLPPPGSFELVSNWFEELKQKVTAGTK
jgi:serine/threonine protein kinase/Tol biopolymer transport system component